MSEYTDIVSVIESIQDKSPVTGLTHSFYRYPARFSPQFSGAAISHFTKPGDIVYDPFMGGGTTLVEAMRLGRRSLGTDVNSLAVFVAKTKTALYSDKDIARIRDWVSKAQSALKLTRIPNRPTNWIADGYQRNISGRTTWPVRKILELALEDVLSLREGKRRHFARCLILKTAQWAVDCRTCHPSASDFRLQLGIHAEEMILGVHELRKAVEELHGNHLSKRDATPKCLHLSANDIAGPSKYPYQRAPKLILTSPPYPGVHVLYHRWQVNGRRETPAPYWIADCLDGNGPSYYTFGNRHQKGLEDYFENMRKSYGALRAIADANTLLVQLVAFSAPEWQLPLFLQILQECGFKEVLLDEMATVVDGRSWRTVPNRKFYADNKGSTPSSKEVLLIHGAA